MIQNFGWSIFSHANSIKFDKVRETETKKFVFLSLVSHGFQNRSKATKDPICGHDIMNFSDFENFAYMPRMVEFNIMS